MIKIRKAAERGAANLGWLDSKHTFSFGEYHDPAHMGFGVLRVINDDTVQPGKGFATHGHKDMEIVSYTLDGALEHKDSMGNGSVMRAGDVQRMTAGTGVTHSEFNHSKDELVHFLQIWVLPDRNALEPGYEQKNFDDNAKKDRLRLVASENGAEGSLTVHQDINMYASVLSPGTHLAHALDTGRQAWVQIARGDAVIGDTAVSTGDGIAITDAAAVDITANAETELLLFDMPA